MVIVPGLMDMSTASTATTITTPHTHTVVQCKLSMFLVEVFVRIMQFL